MNEDQGADVTSPRLAGSLKVTQASTLTLVEVWGFSHMDVFCLKF